MKPCKQFIEPCGHLAGTDCCWYCGRTKAEHDGTIKNNEEAMTNFLTHYNGLILIFVLCVWALISMLIKSIKGA